MKTLWEEPDSRFLSREQCLALVKRVAGMGDRGERTQVGITSSWIGDIRFGRNRVSGASDTRNTSLGITRFVNGAPGAVTINRLDDVTLDAAVRRAERLSSLNEQSAVAAKSKTRETPYSHPSIWSDATYGLAQQHRAELVRDAVAAIQDAGLVGAGYLQVAGHGKAWIEEGGPVKYYPHTTAQYSVTVRDPQANASGWAGLDHHDFTKIDVKALTKIAIEKCVRSRNPVAIEPGRYTAILEPQAVCDLSQKAFIDVMDRPSAEGGNGPYASPRRGFSKIGMQMFDSRVTVNTDSMDPELGYVPFSIANGQVYRPSTWVQSGKLVQLSHDDAYAMAFLHRNDGQMDPGSFRMSGGNVTIEDMIASTERGVLITRFSNISVIDDKVPLYAGYTRDGTWLIERGKVVKPVKNFRFLESPFFVLNNVEQMGTPVRVFHPSGPVVVPPLKVRDFNLVSLSDAF